MPDVRSQIHVGMAVRSSDYEAVGKVVRCDADGFLIEKGLLFKRDYLVRYEEVEAIEYGELILWKRAVDLPQVEDHDHAPLPH